MVNSESFGNGIAICTICQQGLDPFADPLQTISICGHVFHEFCLQESFGYFDSVKRYSCPVCRQICNPDDATRLYFEPILSHTPPPPPPPVGDDSEELRREAKELRRELQLCKQQARKEVAAIKNEAEKQQTAMQETLDVKSEALAKSSLECSSLQEKNLALAKELAAFKLVSNLDLDDKEVLMVTALGNGANNMDRIDVIRKSLVLSNRKRKELMAQCNLLQQGEACLSKKLEKAEGKINRLKTKVQELTDQCNLLEQGAESRYSKKLEKAKAKISKLKTRIQDLKTDVEVKKETSPLGPTDLSELMGSVSGTCNDTAQAPSGDIEDVLDNVKQVEPLARSDNVILILDDDVNQVQPMLSCTKESPITQPLARSDPVILDGVLNQPMLSCTKESPITQPLARSDPVILDGVLNQGQSMLNVTKEYPITQPFSRPVSTYFSGGLIGPDGTKRFLGKWCKRNKTDESATSKNSSTDASHLVVVVSDEEGDKENIMQSKRCKYEAKSNNIESVEVL